MSGGIEKSLITLLQNLEYDKYQVDLLLVRNAGEYMSFIPKQVNILPELRQTPQKILREKKYYKFFFLGIGFLVMKMTKNIEKYYRRLWKCMQHVYEPIKTEYDVIISYNDGLILYYMVEKLNACKKITWTHTMYTAFFEYKPDLDRPYFDAVDNIIEVSQDTADEIVKCFPECKDKVQIIENITNVEFIRKQAEAFEAFPNSRGINIVSVGRMSQEKGIGLIVESANLLNKRGYVFTWSYIGDTTVGTWFQHKVAEYGLEGKLVYLGIKVNPYPFIKGCDLFVHPSYIEGKAIVVEEAKALAKPIVVTNYSTASSQIEDGKNGLIAEINAESLTEKIETLLNNAELAQSFSDYLKNNYKTNREEMVKRFNHLVGVE